MVLRQVLLGVATGLAILRDVIRHPQPMQIMNVTWPVNGLFTPVFGWWVYKKLGRPDAEAGGHVDKPHWQSTLVGVTHCAGGCVLGDSIAAPLVTVAGFTVFGVLLLGHFVGEFVAMEDLFFYNNGGSCCSRTLTPLPFVPL